MERLNYAGKENAMKKILLFIGGAVAGFALCLTAARLLPIDDIDEYGMF